MKNSIQSIVMLMLLSSILNLKAQDGFLICDIENADECENIRVLY